MFQKKCNECFHKKCKCIVCKNCNIQCSIEKGHCCLSKCTFCNKTQQVYRSPTDQVVYLQNCCKICDLCKEVVNLYSFHNCVCFCCKKNSTLNSNKKYSLCDECEKDKPSQIEILKKLDGNTHIYYVHDEKYGELTVTTEGLFIDVLKRIETLENDVLELKEE